MAGPTLRCGPSGDGVDGAAFLATESFGDKSGPWPALSPKLSVATDAIAERRSQSSPRHARREEYVLGDCCGEATAKRLGIDAEHGDGMQDRAREPQQAMLRAERLRLERCAQAPSPRGAGRGTERGRSFILSVRTLPTRPSPYLFPLARGEGAPTAAAYFPRSRSHLRPPSSRAYET